MQSIVTVFCLELRTIGFSAKNINKMSESAFQTVSHKTNIKSANKKSKTNFMLILC